MSFPKPSQDDETSNQSDPGDLSLNAATNPANFQPQSQNPLAIQNYETGLFLQQISGIQSAAASGQQQLYSEDFNRQNYTSQTQQTNSLQSNSVQDQITALVIQIQQQSNPVNRQSNPSDLSQQQQVQEHQPREQRSSSSFTEESMAPGFQQLLSNIGFPEALHSTVVQALETQLRENRFQNEQNTFTNSTRTNSSVTAASVDIGSPQLLNVLQNLLNSNFSVFQQQLQNQFPANIIPAASASSTQTQNFSDSTSQTNPTSSVEHIPSQRQTYTQESPTYLNSGLNALTGHPPVILYLACDEDSLSAYQCLARQQVELFEACEEDVDSNAQGRNRPIVLGQVGIRCRHCAILSTKSRARGAVYYPAKFEGVYQAAQNMINSHLYELCGQVPETVRSELVKLRVRKSSAGGGKKYWADGVRVLGVREGDNCLRFEET